MTELLSKLHNTTDHCNNDITLELCCTTLTNSVTSFIRSMMPDDYAKFNDDIRKFCMEFSQYSKSSIKLELLLMLKSILFRPSILNNNEYVI